MKFNYRLTKNELLAIMLDNFYNNETSKKGVRVFLAFVGIVVLGTIVSVYLFIRGWQTTGSFDAFMGIFNLLLILLSAACMVAIPYFYYKWKKQLRENVNDVWKEDTLIEWELENYEITTTGNIKTRVPYEEIANITPLKAHFLIELIDTEKHSLFLAYKAFATKEEEESVYEFMKEKININTENLLP